MAKVLGSKKVVLTVGQANSQISASFKAWGAVHKDCQKGDCIVDAQNLVVSTPAYMYTDSKTYQVLAGIRKMAEKILKIIESGKCTQVQPKEIGSSRSKKNINI